MANKTNTLTIRVPEDLKRRIEKLAALQGVSINQFALYAFTKEISEMQGGDYFSTMVKGTDKKHLLAEIDRILAKVPERTVPEWDRLPDADD
jgi:FAD synthase